MSCRREAHPQLRERGKRIGPAPLLDQRVPHLRAEGSVHERDRNVASSGGRTNMLLMLCRPAWTVIRVRCVLVVRRSSIRSARRRCGWGRRIF